MSLGVGIAHWVAWNAIESTERRQSRQKFRETRSRLDSVSPVEKATSRGRRGGHISRKCEHAISSPFHERPLVKPRRPPGYPSVGVGDRPCSDPLRSLSITQSPQSLLVVGVAGTNARKHHLQNTPPEHESVPVLQVQRHKSYAIKYVYRQVSSTTIEAGSRRSMDRKAYNMYK